MMNHVNWVLASDSAGKIQEFNALFTETPFRFTPQSDWNVSALPETAPTFIENALVKARHTASICQLPTLADDSGLVVEALHGAPGIYSARYAGVHGDSKANIQKLLLALKDTPSIQRNAYFYCVLVLVRYPEDPAPIIAEGRWQGSILFEPIGENGFGYDPIFYVTSQDCAAAELSPDLKNQISHRAQAFRHLLQVVRDL